MESLVLSTAKINNNPNCSFSFSEKWDFKSVSLKLTGQL